MRDLRFARCLVVRLLVVVVVVLLLLLLLLRPQLLNLLVLLLPHLSTRGGLWANQREEPNTKTQVLVAAGASLPADVYLLATEQYSCYSGHKINMFDSGLDPVTIRLCSAQKRRHCLPLDACRACLPSSPRSSTYQPVPPSCLHRHPSDRLCVRLF